MADDTTTAPAQVAFDPDQITALLQKLGVQPPAQAPTPADGPGAHGFAGFVGDVGNVLGGGGSGLLGLGPDEQAAAGRRALMSAGINMLIGGGPSYTPKNFGTVLGGGLQAAMQSRDESENRAFYGRGATQQLAQQAFQNRLEQIKTALPLLQMQQRASLGNPFAATAPGAGAPNTSITAAANVPAYGGAVNAPQMPAEYEPYFQAASKETGIPVDVLKAQAAQESGFNPNAKGAAGEIGIFQIKPDTATKPGYGLQGVSSPDVLRDPATNIMFGARYLKARAGNADLTTPAGQAAALTAYNGGGDKKYVEHVFQYMPKGGAPTTQVAAAKPPAAAPAAPPAPGRVQVATATPQSRTDATPAPAATTEAPAYATAPSSAEAVTQAKATGKPVLVAGGQGLTALPNGDLARQPPPAVTTAPPAAVPGQPRDITALKDEELSLPEFQQRYRTPIAPEAGTVKVNPQVQADRQAAVSAAQQAVTQAQQGMRAAEQDWTVQRDDKSLQARSAAQQRLETAQQNLQTAQQNANKLTQDAETESVKNRQAAQQAQDQQLAAAYKDAQDRRAAAALEKQRGQQQENIERIKAGQTFHMQQEEEAAKQTNTNTIAPMAAQAIKAHELNIGLSQLQTVLPNLPKGGGAVGYLLDKHPDLLPLMNAAGVVTDRQADATRLLTGLTAGLSTAMKPVGLGALREYEFDAFKAQLPNLMSTPAGQEKALAYLMNLNDRIQKEAQWTQQHYNRRIPDEMSQKPGATRRALNLDTEDGEPWQQKMDKALGPLVPSYTPPQGQAGSASGQAAWEASLPPGKPFYRTYRDGSTSLEFKPWR